MKGVVLASSDQSHLFVLIDLLLWSVKVEKNFYINKIYSVCQLWENLMDYDLVGPLVFILSSKAPMMFNVLMACKYKNRIQM